jgi:hypothetical protein
MLDQLPNFISILMMILGAWFGFLIVQDEEEEEEKPTRYGGGSRHFGSGDR